MRTPTEVTDEMVHALEAKGLMPSPADDSERADGYTIYFLEDGTQLRVYDEGRLIHFSFDDDTLATTELNRWYISDLLTIQTVHDSL